ncbi:MAG: hypothetical protein AAF434_17025, partial [Pseudomonadota bacterium]
GGGADEFIWTAGDGTDVIEDFNGTEGDELVLGASDNHVEIVWDDGSDAAFVTVSGSAVLELESIETQAEFDAAANDWIVTDIASVVTRISSTYDFDAA